MTFPDWWQDFTKRAEGYSATVYTDTTGNKTVGFGFNLSNPTVRAMIPDANNPGFILGPDDAGRVFDILWLNAVSGAKAYIGDNVWEGFCDNHKGILTDLSYNMGYFKLCQFVKLKAAFLAQDKDAIRREMLDSLWARQVGQRAISLAGLV